MTGKLDWEILDENYDYQQELARAGFADMLHDYERNNKYYEALKKIIKKLKSENKKVHVLDIGTGTGLLSMMAVSCGADKVTACEAFKPMIQVAKKCIEKNGMKGKIELIEKRSTEIKIGVDMSEKANVLVTEVFDTELIGEGAISTFSHALANLLTEDCYVIPDNGTIYIELVDSIECSNWNWLKVDEKFKLNVPNDCENLAGDAIFDIQLTQFENFKPVTEPLEAFKFSFSGKQQLLFENSSVIECISKLDGKIDGIFMWWVLGMDYENEIILSCAPKWHHPTPNNMQWRDHWMQSIYFPKNHLKLKQDEKFYIKCNHDEYSLYFDVISTKNFIEKSTQYSIEKFLANETANEDQERSLGVTLVSRNRLSQLNDTRRNERFLSLLEKYQDPTKNILIVNDDFSIISLLIAANLEFNQVIILESNQIRKKCYSKFISENSLSGKVSIIGKSIHELEASDIKLFKRIDLVYSEFSFGHALLPWDNIYFYYGMQHLKQILSQCEESNSFSLEKLIILPCKIRFKAMAVHLEDLDKIRSPVVNSEGFDLTEFDKVIMDASKCSDGFLEPHPLWEYPCYPLSNVYEIFSFDLKNSLDLNTPTELNKKIEMSFTNNGCLNGIAIWHSFEYEDGLEINAGLLTAYPEPNVKLEWTKDYKQAVHILDKKYELNDSNRLNHKLNCIVNFKCKQGDFNVDFKMI